MRFELTMRSLHACSMPRKPPVVSRLAASSHGCHSQGLKTNQYWSWCSPCCSVYHQRRRFLEEDMTRYAPGNSCMRAASHRSYPGIDHTLPPLPELPSHAGTCAAEGPAPAQAGWTSKIAPISACTMRCAGPCGQCCRGAGCLACKLRPFQRAEFQHACDHCLLMPCRK